MTDTQHGTEAHDTPHHRPLIQRQDGGNESLYIHNDGREFLRYDTINIYRGKSGEIVASFSWQGQEVKHWNAPSFNPRKGEVLTLTDLTGVIEANNP